MSQACWPASRRISMTSTFQRDVQLTARLKNNLTGTGRCNYIHSTHVAQPIDGVHPLLILADLKAYPVCALFLPIETNYRLFNGKYEM